MSFTFATLWHDRRRYLPGVFAVAFSAVLIALQAGLLIGMLSTTSVPIDKTRADFWVGWEGLKSVDLGRPIPESHRSRFATDAGVTRVEPYLQGFLYWLKPKGGAELVIVVGCNLENDSLGAVDGLTPELRYRLTEPFTIIVDEADLTKLGLVKPGPDVPVQEGKIFDRTVQLVGTVKGYKSLQGSYVFCSLSTARALLRYQETQVTYFLGSTNGDKAAAKAVVNRLNAQYADPTPGKINDLTAFTSEDFVLATRMYWLWRTGAGLALGFAALLGLLVGAVVTSQTLYAATAGAIREYAVLRALGIPRWRMSAAVLTQSFWIGLLGVVAALPAAFGIARAASMVGVIVSLKPELLAGTAIITEGMALAAGLTALRSLRHVEPANLLR
ncbi:MAG: ABC transporter permease [Gemmataceae bacterium]